MSTPIEFGTVREVWFATLSAPTTKFSFLIRDDAYSKAGAVFGRTIRLGDPISLGPNGTWVQNTWEGGKDQDTWKDKAMFKDGTADGTTKQGKLRMHMGYTMLFGSATRKVDHYLLCRGVTGVDGATPLYAGEGTYDNLTGETNYTFWKWNPATSTASALKTDFASSITAIAPVASSTDGSGGHLLIGEDNGKVWRFNASTDAFTLEYTHTSGGIGIHSIAPFGDTTYYTNGQNFNKRTWDGTTATHTQVKAISNVNFLRGMTVWNNRLWFGGVSAGNTSRLYISDGVTVTEALVFPSELHLEALHVHYGSLYISGWRPPSQGGTGTIGEIWRYNGTSLTKLWEDGTGQDNEVHRTWRLTSWGKYLVWPKHGYPNGDRKAGVYMYDAEQDAIFVGPTFEMATADTKAYWVSDVQAYNGALVIGSRSLDTTSPNTAASCVAQLNKAASNSVINQFNTATFGTGKSFADQPSTVERFVLSSLYDGEIPGESKVWLTGRVRVKIPQGTEVIVKVLLDESTTETTLQTITYDAAQTGWRVVTFPIKASGDYLLSTTIQYKLYLRNTDRFNYPTNNPEVDSVSVDFMPSPKKRRSWRLRVLASEAQTRLDGSANSLTTTAALVQKLEDLWASARPVYFWDAGAAGGTPADTSTAVEVMITDFLAQPYRLESSDTALVADVSFGLTEVVQS